jgi:hypothetical protein
MNDKKQVKNYINAVGLDIILQSIIEMIDDDIDASDYDVDSVKNPNDIWKFKVIEGLEHAYEAFLNQTDSEETV